MSTVDLVRLFHPVNTTNTTLHIQIDSRAAQVSWGYHGQIQILQLSIHADTARLLLVYCLVFSIYCDRLSEPSVLDS